MIKDSSKQTGSAHIVVISLIIVALVGTLGFVFWNNFINKHQKAVTTDSSAKTTKGSGPKKADIPKFDTAIHSVDIKMQNVADVDRLPSYTPSSFVSYMKKLIESTVPGQRLFGCTTEYQISQISQVNIAGGTVPVDGNGETCPGGVPDMWVLNPAGTWDQVSRNDVMCKSENGGAVYEEFASECDSGNGVFIKNPNGSIVTLGK